MKFTHKYLCELMGVESEFVTKRYECRLLAALYRNHFLRLPSGEWEYIGSFTPAEAMADAQGSIGGSAQEFDGAYTWRKAEGR